MALSKKIRAVKFHLKALIYPETVEGETLWCAHCLDFDIVADGKSPREAFAALDHLVGAHIAYAMEHEALDSLYKPAPGKYWNAFYKRNILSREERKREEIQTIAPEIAFHALRGWNYEQEAI